MSKIHHYVAFHDYKLRSMWVDGEFSVCFDNTSGFAVIEIGEYLEVRNLFRYSRA